MKVLVTGAYGQLGRCIYDIIHETFTYKNNEYIFASHSEFDITDIGSMEKYFFYNPDIKCIINCAAYTNVDGAEKDPYTVFYINSRGVQNLVQLCEKYDIMLFHISTDYVYKDCQSLDSLCTEDSEIEPINIYGQSKRDGELHIINSNLKNWYIFRTSWLYSEYPGNFFTKILEKAKKEYALTVVTDEVGCPTYAKDLASMLICIIEHEYYKTTLESGIYNYSGLGFTSRYDFASSIIAGGYNIKVNDKKIGIHVPIYPIKQKDLNLSAKRPQFVVLNNQKISKIPVIRDNWIFDLQSCINNYEKKLNKENNNYRIMYGKDLY